MTSWRRVWLLAALGLALLAVALQPVRADSLPGFESNTWFGLYGPGGLSSELLARVNSAANQALADPEVREKLLRLGIEPVGGSPVQFSQMVLADAAKWKKIITERKITAE